MHPVSPQMSGLPILALLLLLAHRAPLTQGQPLQTYYSMLISELEDLVNRPPVPSESHLEFDDKFILANKIFLKANLEAFLSAAKNFGDKAEKIRKILAELQAAVPTSTSTDDPISIDTNDWDDFRRKLTEFLNALKKFINASPSSPTPSSLSGPS